MYEVRILEAGSCSDNEGVLDVVEAGVCAADRSEEQLKCRGVGDVSDAGLLIGPE